MSSLVRHRVIRAASSREEVFVSSEPSLPSVLRTGTLLTISEMLEAAGSRAEAIIAAAEQEAAGILAAARARSEATLEAGRQQGFAAGLEAAEQQVGKYVAVGRTMANEGLAIRNAAIEDALPAIARAVAMATRRIVGAAYEADPALVADCVEEAVRAASGQNILSVRLHPSSVEAVRARLVDIANYIRPDDGVAIGGCVIDLKNGTLDASLDARLSMMELALNSASGETE